MPIRSLFRRHGNPCTMLSEVIFSGCELLPLCMNPKEFVSLVDFATVDLLVFSEMMYIVQIEWLTRTAARKN